MFLSYHLFLIVFICFAYCSFGFLSTTMNSRFISKRLFSSATNQIKENYILEYVYVPNMFERRAPFREAHLNYANEFVSKNILKAGGALLPEVKKGILLFTVSDPKVVEDFAKNDPYVKNGLVTEYSVAKWAVAVGSI